MRFLPAWRRLSAPRLLVAFPMALLVLPLHAAGSGTPLSLDVATQLAAQRAPQVQARLLQTQAARHDAVRAGRLPDPQLTVGINNLTATGAQAFNAAADSMTMRSIGLMQVIPSSAKRHAEKSVAQASVQLNAAEVTQVRLAVKQATAGAWVRRWATEADRQQLEGLHGQFDLAVKLAKAKLRGGTGSATDVLAAQSAVVQLANRITAVDAEITAARAALQRWVGQDADQTLAAAPIPRPTTRRSTCSIPPSPSSRKAIGQPG